MDCNCLCSWLRHTFAVHQRVRGTSCSDLGLPAVLVSARMPRVLRLFLLKILGIIRSNSVTFPLQDLYLYKGTNTLVSGPGERGMRCRVMRPVEGWGRGGGDCDTYRQTQLVGESLKEIYHSPCPCPSVSCSPSALPLPLPAPGQSVLLLAS